MGLPPSPMRNRLGRQIEQVQLSQLVEVFNHGVFFGVGCNDSTTDRNDIRGEINETCQKSHWYDSERFSSSNAARQGFSVARAVVKADNRTASLPVLNVSTSQIELVSVRI